MQDKRIVVLLDDVAVRREVIQYSIALAQRIDAQITLLMLLPNVPPAGPGEGSSAEAGRGTVRTAADAVASGEAVLSREAEHIADAGLEVDYEVVKGEPRSEFLKFMATRLSFHTAVWGGDPRALRQGPGRLTDHWLASVRHELSCPLVSPTRKRRALPETPKRR